MRIPLAMMNRHGIIAGATGTGKTKTLQAIAEQLSSNGVPVVMADIKGDLSGLSRPGVSNDRIVARAQQTGDDWAPQQNPVEFVSLGGRIGVPIRATITSFGPILLSKVLSLNATQESTLGLIFHWADQRVCPCSISRTCGRSSPTSPATRVNRNSRRSAGCRRRRPA